jgi:hypothetical protein
MLNGRVFLWVTEQRVQTLLNARAYRDRVHTVITLDTAGLFARHAHEVTLSPINSGSTIYNPQPRGSQTFRPLTEYPFEARRRMRGVDNAVAEVAVPYAVPDLRDFTLRVDHRQNEQVHEIVFARIG